MTDQKKSVLFIHSGDLTSPLGTTVPYYVTQRIARSHRVHTICREKPAERDMETTHTEVVHHDIRVGQIPVVSGLAFAFISLLYAVYLGLSYRYDAVYAYKFTVFQGWIASVAGGSRFTVGLQTVPVAQFRDLSTSAEISGGIGKSLKNILYSGFVGVLRVLLQDADEIVCLTEEIREVTEEFLRIDLADAHVIGMGVDLDKFNQNNTYNANKSPSERWTITYVGTIHQTRGLDHIIEAMSQTTYVIRLRVAGTGSEEHVAALKQKAREHDVSDDIEWLGLVPHDQIPELLQSTDIAVSPLADIESYRVSFPAKLLEYMASGTLVIATDIPPHRRLIEHEENGILYDGGATAFQNALERCIRKNDRSMREAARQTAEEYGWDTIAERHAAILFS